MMHEHGAMGLGDRGDDQARDRLTLEAPVPPIKLRGLGMVEVPVVDPLAQRLFCMSEEEANAAAASPAFAALRTSTSRNTVGGC
jgi:hypothetical protein